jgi:iron complex outermembrane receptor protein
MTLRLLLIIGLSMVAGTMLAQDPVASECSFAIEGKVYDAKTEEPLAFVSIQLLGTTQGTVTDEDGGFSFSNLCEEEYDLLFSYVGYKTVRHHHDFHHPFLEIYLAPEDYVLESVVVEATTLQSGLESISTSRLSGEELEAVSSESFGDVVSEIAGVSTLKTGQNVVKPVIHGLHSNRVLIINNGLRHEFQNWGIEHAPEIDPSGIDEIEVVKGAATVRFGPDALGGVILANPAPMELSTPLRGNVELTGKSNGRSVEGNTEWQKGFKALSLLAGGSYVKQGDLRAPDYLLTNTGKEEHSYYGGFRLHPFAKLDLEGYYSRFDQKLGILLGSTFGNLEDLERAITADEPLFTGPFSYDIGQPRQETVHDLYKATARYVTDKQSIEIQYGYQNNRRREFGLRRGEAPNIDLELVTQSIEANWLHPNIGPVSGRFGFQGQQQANDNLPGTNTVPFIPNYDSWQYGFFLIESLQLGENTYEVGIRYDKMEADITGREPDNKIYRNTIAYDNVTATVGYMRQLSRTASFRSNFGTAWRPPNVAELYRFGQHSFFLEYGLWRYVIDDRFDFVSTSRGILTEEDRPVPSEVGFKWINTYTVSRENFQFEATAYVNYIKNYIYSKPGGLTRTPRGFFVYFLYDQTDALFWGVDLSSRIEHSPQFSSNFSGSYLWSKQVQPNDFFVGQPPANLRYAIEYRPKWQLLDDNRFQFTALYTFEQFQHPRIITVDEFLNPDDNGINRFVEDASDFDLLPPPEGFFLAHFSWKAAWKKIGWRFQVRNIFNTSYRNYTDRLRYFADDLGRNFVLSLSYRI